MDIEQMKLYWQQLDARMLKLESQQQLQAQKHHLRPLLWGQTLQFTFGISITFLGIGCWQQHYALHLQLTSIVLQLYGTMTALLAAAIICLLVRSDPADSVLATQTHIARLRYLHGLNGLFVGLPWWLLWLPFMMAIAALSGHDLWSTRLSWAYVNLPIGILGLAITLLILAHKRRAPGPGQSAWQALIDQLAGRRLRELHARINEIERFRQQ
jgi:hypothetical protein